MLRYSALIAGVSYGLYHQSEIYARNRQARIDREYAQREALITQAKAEFKKKNMPPESVTRGGQGESFRDPLISCDLDTFWMPLCRC